MHSHASHHVLINGYPYSYKGVERGLEANRVTNETPGVKPGSDANLKVSHLYDVAYRV